MKRSSYDRGRRSFLKGVGAAGLAAMAGPTLAASDEGVEWDQTYDVVIVGSGFSGLAAAIEAKRNGANSVAIIEKMPVFGGNSAINGGLYAAPQTPLQKEEGVTDSPDTMVSDQLKAGRGIADEALLRHVAAHAREGLELCLDVGAKFHPYLQQLGGHSVPRTYQTTVSCGAGITQPLYKECKKLGVILVNRAKLKHFIRASNGQVEGIAIETRYYYDRDVAEGPQKQIRATKGLIMATGGFSQNVRLRMAQDPTLTADVGSTNAAGATGEGLLQMLKLGAIPVHMAHIQSGPWASPDEGGFGYVSNYSIFNFPHSIAIERKSGKRFMNEIADRKTRADAELANRDDQGNPDPALMITSYKHAAKHPNAKKVLKYGVGWKFDSLEELAKNYQIPFKALKAQVDEYNGYVENGKDEQFGKSMTKAKGKYLEPPFMVVRLWPKVHYCQGGVMINQDAQVLDSETGEPIMGLYAAGEVTGGVHGVSRLGSCSIPECIVMGMTASRHIMAKG
ncbi:flavocytochrome c [Ferrimonas sediminum]|uniref:Flavocytochrome c n=1 Tax=Ferrimonas sediminum TaxID=718193 RepID=A0A1G8UE28_9GAMM|nr:flavocytochrome c [Ferrimonas sediminum]SDJ51435.1 flavocytochrome c [Ferrimonas sediminum]